MLGNYDRLVNAVLDEFSDGLDGDTLQISCAYGKLTPRLESRLNEGGRLDVIDVLKVQLENVRRKLKWPGERVRLIQCDATRLNCPDASYDQVLMFFLPHELPGDKRRQALSEAVRVVKPGGRSSWSNSTGRNGGIRSGCGSVWCFCFSNRLLPICGVMI